MTVYVYRFVITRAFCFVDPERQLFVVARPDFNRRNGTQFSVSQEILSGRTCVTGIRTYQDIRARLYCHFVIVHPHHGTKRWSHRFRPFRDLFERERIRVA